ncbi:isocitrate lyase/phosphoenolpyruvate mutase family protein [Bacillus sp. SL00103]
MVESKVANVQIEDQQMPKKMRAFKRKITCSSRKMVAKIKAIKQAAPTLLVIARTDAKSVNGMEDVIRRSNLYVEAGADAIFLRHSSPQRTSRMRQTILRVRFLQT